MKVCKIFILLISAVMMLSSCNDWLDQEDKNSMTEDQAYSDDASILSITANLYGRMVIWQDFAQDGESYDMCRWDEAINNSQYWSFATNIGTDYRVTYDYGYIRELNQHIKNLETIAKGKISEDSRIYYIAEARWLRAMQYFRMVVSLGGVPLITEMTEYKNDPSEYALPRNKESEVYDFIISECDAIKDSLKSSVKTRATKGAALALKCRAALYAGTLAYNHDKSEALNLNLASGATGISYDMTSKYLNECIDAYKELESLGTYSLYKKKENLSDNYANLFVDDYSSNPEIIFCKAYDGIKVQNNFTARAIPRSCSTADLNKTACQIDPVLNLVNCYEKLSTRKNEDIDAYVGDEQLEDMSASTSNLHYNVYDKPEDIFADRDPRLAGTVLYAGSSFRGVPVDLRAGLAVPNASGGYDFKQVNTKNDLASNNTYEGQTMTGVDGPVREGDGNWYISHTGFLLRKLVDPTSGSELNGESTVPYIVFRYGEMVLNAAEAAFYLGDRSTALTLINKIRNRAGGLAFEISDSELTLDRIKNERRVELSFEDHRYEDMKRWRDADEFWKDDVDSPTATMYCLWPYKIYDPGNADNGKWIFRKMRVQHRVNNGTIAFTRSMYYSAYPQNEGNPNTEKNPNQ